MRALESWSLRLLLIRLRSDRSVLGDQRDEKRHAGAVRTVIERQVTRSRRRDCGSDADQLARIPEMCWVAAIFVVSLAIIGFSSQFLGLYCVVDGA